LSKTTTRHLGDQISILGSLVGIMWAIEILDLFLHGALNQFGIIPRSDIGLRGIILSPFLHGSVQHLFANTIPFVALGWLVMLRRTSDFWTVSLIVVVISGLGTWMLGSPGSVHIGASGVVFGYLGFLLARAVFERSLSAVFLAIVAGSLYGSLIWGISPFQRGISWEGHLCGLIGGGVAAWLMAKAKRQTELS
jgi:membrane associated rhomboid family serine protease